MLTLFKSDIVSYFSGDEYHSRLKYVIMHERLDLLKIIYSATDAFLKIDRCTTDAMAYAATNGHFDTVEWSHLNRFEGCTSDAMDQAAANGQLEIVTWLNFNRSEGCTTSAMDGASRNGHLDIVKIRSFLF